MQAALGDAHVVRHGAIHAVAEAAARRVEIVKTGAAERRSLVDHGGGLADYAVAFFELGDAGTGAGNGTGKLVAKNARVVYRPPVRSTPLVQIAATDANCAHAEEHITLANFGNGNFAQFYRERIWSEVYDGGHAAHADTCRPTGTSP
jgi:hypothetical protein